jgi:hypothetical protein
MDDTPESRLEAFAAAMEANDVTRIPEGYMIDNGRYWLFDVECPTEIMAAYERLHRGYNVQDNGDILLAWIVTTTLVRSDTTFGQRMVDALKVLGWQSPT